MNYNQLALRESRAEFFSIKGNYFVESKPTVHHHSLLSILGEYDVVER